MNNSVEPLDLAALAAGNGGDIAQRLLALWRAGELTGQNLMPISDRLVVLAGAGTSDATPPILFAGPSSYASTVMGRKWHAEPSRASERLDTRYRETISDSYRLIPQTGEPTYDRISTQLRDVDGCEVGVLYDRLLLPVIQSGGALQIICYSQGLETVRRDGKSGRARPAPTFPRKTALLNLPRPAVLKSAMPQGGIR